MIKGRVVVYFAPRRERADAFPQEWPPKGGLYSATSNQRTTFDSPSRSVGQILDQVRGPNATFIYIIRETNGGYEDAEGLQAIVNSLF